MPDDIPLNPVEVPPQRRFLNPFRTKLRGLLSLVAIAVVTIASAALAYRAYETTPVKASSTNPAIAVRQERVVHGVRWGLSFEAALEQARSDGIPVLAYFGALADLNCRLLEQQVLTHPDVTPLLLRFVRVQLYKDQVPISSLSKAQQVQLALANVERQRKLTGETVTPCFLVLSTKGQLVTKLDGFQSPGDLAAFLRRALTQAPHESVD